MTRANTGTKEEILRIGKQLIQVYGYNAFSYADISKELNIKNAAVHYHFRAKEDLLLGILEGNIEQYKALGSYLQAGDFSSKAKLEKFIERYSSLVEIDCICIIGSVASDFNTLPSKVKAKISELVELVLGMVEKVLQEGRKNGSFHFTESARAQTLLIMTNLAAGVQLARITGKKDYETIRKAILKQLTA